ncbi:hypothetical protein QQF64_023373 [Cirrhinus molitorella]|uniref:Uncharacterized protein n=1 Tax=Cirrhinus molitorella TaxID=172907 RepID=A0ABR3L566_9TELE
MPNVSVRDRLYLIRITSSRKVRKFLSRQSDAVKADYKQLQQALIKEFSDPESEQGLVAAMDLKQNRLSNNCEIWPTRPTPSTGLPLKRLLRTRLSCRSRNITQS